MSRVRLPEAGLSTATTSSGLFEEARTRPRYMRHRDPHPIDSDEVADRLSGNLLAIALCIFEMPHHLRRPHRTWFRRHQCGDMVGDCHVFGSAFFRPDMVWPGLR